MGATDRLAELGITLPEPVTPMGSYVPATQVGSLIYCSGQTPYVRGKLLHTGKVDVEVSLEDAHAAARQAALNAVAAIDALVGLDNVKRVIKMLGFVASDPAFTRQAAVIDGASDVLVEIFGADGRHARSAVGMSALPADTPVEVEIIVEVG